MTNTLWQNARIFFPGDEIPDPLPKDFLYLYVSARYLGYMHNRYSAVHSMLQRTEGSRVFSRIRRDFEWMPITDTEIDRLFDMGINILHHRKGLGPIVNGNRIHGTLLPPASLAVMGDILRAIRVQVASLWTVFLEHRDRPHEGSTIIMRNIENCAMDAIYKARADRMIMPDDGHVKVFESIYSAAVKVGGESFVVECDVMRRAVTVSFSPTLMSLIKNVVGMESIGNGDIMVDPLRVLSVDLPGNTATSMCIKYHYEVQQ